MASSFTWLDYSEDDREKVLDILRVFNEPEARDELGIGVIRDAFSDMFFPGTSTIQTRARYFLFVPWIYKKLEEKKVPSLTVERRARNEEIKLIFALLDSNDKSGVIGKEAKRNLERLPSSIYWHGLGSWGIRLCPYSISDYHRSLDDFYGSKKVQRIDGYDTYGPRYNWHPSLPQAPDDFPEKASFDLTYDEASYLKERVLSQCPDTMLAFLLKFKSSFDAAFPWDHPICPSLPKTIQEKLIHARNFSDVIYGAALLYNLMLAEKAIGSGLPDFEGMASEFKSRLKSWAYQLRWTELDEWDYKGRFWELVCSEGARPANRTRTFVNDWFQMILSPGTANTITDNEYARKLIIERESFLKGPKSRLKYEKAFEIWKSDPSPKMIGQLTYRWRPANTIVSDIHSGLRRS